MAPRWLVLLVLGLCLGCTAAEPAERARGNGLGFALPWSVRVLDDGRILVTDSDAGSVFEVDRATGDRRVVVSSTADSPLIPGGVAPAPGARLYVADMARRAVLLFRGDGRLVRVLSQEGVRGAGPGLKGNLRLEPLPGGLLAVLDEERDAVLTVDPSTGDRRFLVQEGLLEAVDLALWRDRLVILDTRPGRVFEVGPDGMALLIDLRDGRGPAMPSPEGLGTSADGGLLVSDNVNGVVVSVDPDTLVRRVVNRPDQGDGPTLSELKDLAGLPDGSILASVPDWRCLVEVGPDGRRRLVSGEAPPSRAIRVVPYSLARHEARLPIGDVLERRHPRHGDGAGRGDAGPGPRRLHGGPGSAGPTPVAALPTDGAGRRLAGGVVALGPGPGGGEAGAGSDLSRGGAPLKLEPELGPAALGSARVEPSPVRLHQGARDGQPQARPAGVP